MYSVNLNTCQLGFCHVDKWLLEILKGGFIYLFIFEEVFFSGQIFDTLISLAPYI